MNVSDFISGQSAVTSLINTEAAKRQQADAASSKASDTGAVAFGQGQGFRPALKANQAAQKAWANARDAAAALQVGAKQAGPAWQSVTALAGTRVQDAADRIGELQVADSKLTEELAKHVRLKFPNRPQAEQITTAQAAAQVDGTSAVPWVPIAALGAIGVAAFVLLRRVA